MAAVDFDTLDTRPVHGEDEYTSMLCRMLPLGPIWGFTQRLIGSLIQDTIGEGTIQDEPGEGTLQDVVVDGTNVSPSLFGRFWSVISAELARLETRSFELVLEATPGKSIELLDQWEAQAGLPSPCLEGEVQTLEERQTAAHMKLYGENETVTVEYLEDYALSLGYVIEITEGGGFSTPFETGLSQVGDRLGQWDVRSTMVIEVISGANPERLQCIFSDILPSHVIVVWII